MDRRRSRGMVRPLRWAPDRQSDVEDSRMQGPPSQRLKVQDVLKVQMKAGKLFRGQCYDFKLT
jgi:hypothetical protein